jgi:protein O-mannosyl-transferase
MKPEFSRTTGRMVPLPAWEAVLLIALVGATVAAYWPVGVHPFVALDDMPYVVNNSHITYLNWEMVKWSFTTFRGANWFPVTWLSHAVDYRLFALRSGRHHQMNLLLHVFNALLLFWALRQATGSMARSWVVAALFALHPLNVESVAWVAERKNLLSMFFFLLALGAYYAYARKPRVGSYLVVFVLFALGLMSKPQIITFPFVLLLWDYWPLQRIAFRSSPFAFRQTDLSDPYGEQQAANGEERASGARRTAKGEQRPVDEARMPTRGWRFLLLEKLPLLALSVASAFLTVRAQIAGGTMSGAVNSFSFAARVGNAIIAYVRYLGYAIWPARLAFFYPHARAAPPMWQWLGASAVLILLTALAIRASNHRYLIVGWLWFMGTLVPMIGLVQVGSQAMADRYAYLPLIGIFLAVAWGIADWAAQWQSSKVWIPVSAMVVLLAMALQTRRQVDYWSDEETLWTHTLEVTRNNGFAENMLGEYLLRRGEWEASIPYFRAAAAMQPMDPLPHLHIGMYEEEHKHPYAALQELQQVLDITQPYVANTPHLRSNALVYMGYAYNQLGDYANQDKCVKEAGGLLMDRDEARTPVK